MEDSNEIWLPIKGYEGLYQVSNMGRVRSIDRVVPCKGGQRLLRGRVLKPEKNNYGYLYVNLSKDGIVATKTIHRLVVQAFVENSNPEDFTEVNHKDEDPSNNRWDNLEWCDRKYNQNYGTGMYRSVEKRSKPVEAFNGNGIVHRFASVKETGRNGFSPPNVSACCNGKLKTYKGLHWRFADDTSEV